MTETSEERAARSIEDIFARGAPGGWISGRYISPVEMRRNAIVSVIGSCISEYNSALQAENFALAADQCHAGYGDEYGNHRCKEVDELRAKLATANALMAGAYDLLTALKAVAPEGWLDDSTMEHMPGIKQARAAIDKAEGRAVASDRL